MPATIERLCENESSGARPDWRRNGPLTHLLDYGERQAAMQRTHDLNTVPARIRAKITVDESTGCWLWTGTRNNRGYASGMYPGSNTSTLHRGMWIGMVGPIPHGVVLDHGCRVRHCINPAHLEPVTNRENVLRGAKSDLKTRCAKGHPWTPDNIRWRTSVNPPRRQCLTCYRDFNRKSVRRG